MKPLVASISTLALLLTVLVYLALRSPHTSALFYHGDPIAISRDQHNIPTINASSYRTALYAWGYVMAEDRLFQMAFRRAAVQGQLAQCLGQKMVEVDKMFRELGLYAWAQRTAVRFMRENRTEYDNMQAYADGVNDYYRSRLLPPIEFIMTGLQWQDWTVTDIIAFYKLIKWSLSFGMAEQYIRSSLLKNLTRQQVDLILPYRPQHWLAGQHVEHTTIVKDDEIPADLLHRSNGTDFSKMKPVSVEKMAQIGHFEFLDTMERASNSWAVGGEHTQSGHPIICNDPHLENGLPGEWYQIKVYYQNEKKEQFYFIGGSIVGLPTGIGKTTYIALTITTNYMDSQDLYKEKIEGNKYQVDGKWLDLKVRKQIIYVKNRQPVEFEIRETHRGPIIKHMIFKGTLYKIQQDLSLAWIGFTDSEFISLAEYSHIAQAKSLPEIRTKLQTYTDYGPPFNLIYATRDGDIGYHTIGVIPIRRHPHQGMYVQDGTRSENDWLGLVRGRDNLHVENPKKGYISNGNNKAVSQKYFSGILGTSIYTGRATRIEKMIEGEIKAGRKITKQFLKKVQLDTVDTYCLEIVSRLQAKIHSSEPTYNFVFSPLSEFDCNFNQNSTTASYYLVFLHNLYLQLHPQGATPTLHLSQLHPHYQYLYSFLLRVHTQAQLLLLNRTATATLAHLHTNFNSYNPPYSVVHTDYMPHRPFSFVPWLRPHVEVTSPGWGNMNTVNVGVMNKFGEGDFRTNHRANIRLVMSYGEDSEWVVDGGSSEKWYRRYYLDQHELFVNGGYAPMDTVEASQSL